MLFFLALHEHPLSFIDQLFLSGKFSQMGKKGEGFVTDRLLPTNPLTAIKKNDFLLFLYPLETGISQGRFLASAGTTP